MQPAEAVLKLLAVHVGASARAEPRGRAEVHVVDDEAVATGVRIQDVCLHNDGFQNHGQGCLSALHRRGHDPWISIIWSSLECQQRTWVGFVTPRASWTSTR